MQERSTVAQVVKEKNFANMNFRILRYPTKKIYIYSKIIYLYRDCNHMYILKLYICVYCIDI